MARTVAVALVALVGVLFSSAASAQERRFGSWTVGIVGNNEGLFAATMNDSGGILGQYCYRDEGQCVWVLANDVGCEDGSTYPVLVNADSGATSTEIRCVHVDGKPRYLFSKFELIEDIVRDATRVGFASPMKSGTFRVSRFSLDGAASAIAYMEKVMQSVLERASRGTSDQVY